MLNKRTQILLSQELWENLTRLAQEQKTSAGQLIRRAVEKSYFQKRGNEKTRRAIEKIMSVRPHFKGRIDYKKLINDGREV